MSHDLSLRPFDEGDGSAVRSVHEAAFRASNMTFVEEAAVDEELEDVTASYLDVGGTFLVGTVEGGVVATGGYRPVEDGVVGVVVEGGGGGVVVEGGGGGVVVEGGGGGVVVEDGVVGDDVAEIGHVRVHPDHQRHGHADSLMDKLESRAADEGFERLVLETHEDLTAAQALYEDRGYAVVARTIHPKSGDEMIHYEKSR